MKTVIGIILIILFLLMLVGPGCSSECKDETTLQQLQIELSQEQNNQKQLQIQYNSLPDGSEKTAVQNEIYSSLSKQESLDREIKNLKQNSKCL